MTATSSSPRNPGAGPLTITATGCPPPATAGSGPRAAPGIPPPWIGAPAPKTAPVDTSYVGWAPIPPPDYVPTPAYAPASGVLPRGSGGGLRSPRLLDLCPGGQLPAGFRAALHARLLLRRLRLSGAADLCADVLPPDGHSSPPIIRRAYYPQYLFRRRVSVGAYSYGPPVSYVSRVTNINQTVINNTIINNTNNITRIHNVMAAPSGDQPERRHIRDITPPALIQGKPLPPSQRVDQRQDGPGQPGQTQHRAGAPGMCRP